MNRSRTHLKRREKLNKFKFASGKEDHTAQVVRSGLQPERSAMMVRQKLTGIETYCRICYIKRMKRDEAIRLLQQHEADLKRLGVEHLYLFGSMARDEATDDSDVDLFFDHEKGKLGLFELMDVKEQAAGILGRKADVITRNSLHPRLKQRIEDSAVRVF